MLLKHSDILSHAIQSLHISPAECQLLVEELTTKTFTKLHTEESFSLFWEWCKKAVTELKINGPVLPHKRQCPIRYFLGEASSEFHDNVKHYYRQIYVESWHCCELHQITFWKKDCVNCYAKVESNLLLAAKGEPFDEYILAICHFYGDDLDQHICTRNLHYLERFLMALIRIALTFIEASIDIDT